MKPEFDTTALLGMRRDDPAGGDFERGEQGRGILPL
jgi:tetratricopeptide (TPR) repeat protein